MRPTILGNRDSKMLRTMSISLGTTCWQSREEGPRRMGRKPEGFSKEVMHKLSLKE